MSYPTIEALDNRIERIVSNTVKHYYTDWKNYDRPKYMRCKGSSDKADRELVLIARDCGTYLLRTEDITNNDSINTLYEYYRTEETADFYLINLDRLSIKKF